MYNIYSNSSSHTHARSPLSGRGYDHKQCTIVLPGQKRGKSQAWLGSMVAWQLTFNHISTTCSTVLKNQSFELLLLSMARQGICPKLTEAALE